MKKILFILSFLIFSLVSKSQYPVTQNLGNSSTLVQVPANGGFVANLINRNFTDTTAANATNIDYYSGAQIFTTSDSSLWWRYNGGWIKMSSATGGATGSFWNLTGNALITTPSGYGLGSNTPDNVPFKTNGTTRAYIPAAGFVRSNDTTSNKIFTLNPSTGEWGYANWNNGGGGGSTPTWQQTLNAGSTLNTDNAIDGGGNIFTWGNNSYFQLEATNGGTTNSLLLNGAISELSTSLGSVSSTLNISTDSISLKPSLGRISIDTLESASSQNTLIGWTSTSGANRGRVGSVLIGTGLSLSGGTLSASGAGIGGAIDSVVNILSLGAVGDGVTDNISVFRAARATGRAIFVPKGTYYVSDSFIINKQMIFGTGVTSIIKVTSSTVTGLYLQDSCDVWGLKFIGTGAGAVPGGTLTTQNGIRVRGGYNNIRDCYFSGITGSGVGLWHESGTTIYQNRVLNNKFIGCTVGIFSLLNDEYSIYSNNDVYACTVGLWDRSGGNSRWENNTVTYCTVDGFRLTSGGNGDHSVVIGCTFNHNETNINIQSNNLGEMFVGCNIEAAIGGNNIVFGSAGTAVSVIISECNLYDGAIVGTSATNCVVRDCNILAGGAGVTHSGSGVTYVNNNGSSDPQYWKSSLNAIGSAGSIGTSDNFGIGLYTNNSKRVDIINTGEVGINTSGASGFKLFIVGAGNTSSTWTQLNRNGNGENVFGVDDAGNTIIGNQSTGASAIKIAGKVGVNETSPTSTIHISGSTAFAFISTSTDITLDGTHRNVILLTGVSVVTLPAASSCPNRIYIINNGTGGNVTIDTYNQSNGGTKSRIDANKTITLQSDGTDWWLIQLTDSF